MNDLQYRSDVALYGIDIRRFSYAVPFNLFRGRFFKFRIPQYNFCNLFIGGERPARLLDIPLDHFSRILYSMAFKGLFAGINFGAQRNFLPLSFLTPYTMTSLINSEVDIFASSSSG